MFYILHSYEERCNIEKYLEMFVMKAFNYKDKSPTYVWCIYHKATKCVFELCNWRSFATFLSVIHGIFFPKGDKNKLREVSLQAALSYQASMPAR